jgi:hypothetical protein
MIPKRPAVFISCESRQPYSVLTWFGSTGETDAGGSLAGAKFCLDINMLGKHNYNLFSLGHCPLFLRAMPFREG